MSRMLKANGDRAAQDKVRRSESPKTRTGDASPVIGALLIRRRFYGVMDDKRLRRNLDRFCNFISAMALRETPRSFSKPSAFRAAAAQGARWLDDKPPAAASSLPSVIAILAILPQGCFTSCRPELRHRRAQGELQPQRLQDVYAKIDGVVADINIQHGQHVTANQILATLKRPQLDFEFKQVLGELQTSRKRLAAIEAERVQTPRDTEEQRRQYGLLAGAGGRGSSPNSFAVSNRNMRSSSKNRRTSKSAARSMANCLLGTSNSLLQCPARSIVGKRFNVSVGRPFPDPGN